jgi:hypothetical protein
MSNNTIEFSVKNSITGKDVSDKFTITFSKRCKQISTIRDLCKPHIPSNSKYFIMVSDLQNGWCELLDNNDLSVLSTKNIGVIFIESNDDNEMCDIYEVLEQCYPGSVKKDTKLTSDELEIAAEVFTNMLY